jgi:hypothetical protein
MKCFLSDYYKVGNGVKAKLVRRKIDRIGSFGAVK